VLFRDLSDAKSKLPEYSGKRHSVIQVIARAFSHRGDYMSEIAGVWQAGRSAVVQDCPCVMAKQRAPGRGPDTSFQGASSARDYEGVFPAGGRLRAGFMRLPQLSETPAGPFGFSTRRKVGQPRPFYERATRSRTASTSAACASTRSAAAAVSLIDAWGRCAGGVAQSLTRAMIFSSSGCIGGLPLASR
jgi:hypothetical protein